MCSCVTYVWHHLPVCRQVHPYLNYFKYVIRIHMSLFLHYAEGVLFVEGVFIIEQFM